MAGVAPPPVLLHWWVGSALPARLGAESGAVRRRSGSVLEAHTINKWAAARSVGAKRDGWRLIGRGKLSAGKQCSVYPPGCASWLFMRV